MRHMRVAAYTIVKGTFGELTCLAEKGVLPLLSDARGFVDYGLVDTGRNAFLEVSIWENHEDARQPTRAAAIWINENIAGRVRLVKIYVGDLALSRSVRIRSLGDALRARAA